MSGLQQEVLPKMRSFKSLTEMPNTFDETACHDGVDQLAIELWRGSSGVCASRAWTASRLLVSATADVGNEWGSISKQPLSPAAIQLLGGAINKSGRTIEYCPNFTVHFSP
jgi:hypothetical protein